jgi:DNA-binding CsgD family transcriptional regulator
MGVFLIGVLFGFLGGQASTMFPLAIANGLGGIYSDFFIWTFPIYLLIGAKRPVLVSTFGFLAYLGVSMLMWTGAYWMPEIFWELDKPILISAGIAAILLLTLSYFVIAAYREKTLAAAVYALLRGDGMADSAESFPSDGAQTTEEQKMSGIGFTEDEIKVAMLLIEGDTRHDITRKLHLTPEDTSQRMNAIRKKISGTDDPDPVITAVVKKYKLTHRQTDMLRHIRDGLTNAEIARLSSISGEPVKGHMRSLKQKLPVGNKQEIAEWLKGFRE